MNKVAIHEEIMDKIWETENEELLKEISKCCTIRIKQLQEQKSLEWDTQKVNHVWKLLSKEQRMLILDIIGNGNSIEKREIIKKHNYKDMKVTGLVSGINNRAQILNRKNIIESCNVNNKKKPIIYKLNEKFREILSEGLEIQSGGEVYGRRI